MDSPLNGCRFYSGYFQNQCLRFSQLDIFFNDSPNWAHSTSSSSSRRSILPLLQIRCGGVSLNPPLLFILVFKKCLPAGCSPSDFPSSRSLCPSCVSSFFLHLSVFYIATFQPLLSDHPQSLSIQHLINFHPFLFCPYTLRLSHILPNYHSPPVNLSHFQLLILTL